MATPLIVVIVVALGSGNEASPVARTVQDALGSDAVVVLREEQNLDDANVSRLGRDLHADALVRILWTRDEARPEAHLHLYATGAAAWTDRDVRFAPDDPTEERGRALGYGIASMVRVGVPPPEAVPPAKRERDGTATLVRSEALPRISLEARFQGAGPIGDAGGSLGGEGALRYRFAGQVALRAGAALRAGDIDTASANAAYLRLGAGVAWTMLESRGSRPISFGGRVDVLALRQSASRRDDTSSGVRWMLAADTLFEVGWAVLPRGALVGAVGAEAAFESTRVLVDEREAATIAPIRILGELGVRIAID
jgi:hypothetical protein